MRINYYARMSRRHKGCCGLSFHRAVQLATSCPCGDGFSFTHTADRGRGTAPAARPARHCSHTPCSMHLVVDVLCQCFSNFIQSCSHSDIQPPAMRLRRRLCACLFVWLLGSSAVWHTHTKKKKPAELIFMTLCMSLGPEKNPNRFCCI